MASKRGLAVQRKEKEILPPRKSLRLQGIDAETGLQLPEKEPTQYFINGLGDDEQRLPLKELELDEIISSKDRSSEVECVSKYLENITHSIKAKNEGGMKDFGDDVDSRLKQLKITVGSLTFL